MMANTLFDYGRRAYLATNVMDWDAAGVTVTAALMNLHVADQGNVLITGATNATPIVITATGHGLTTGDSVYIDGVGGNLAANGLWKVTVVDSNTFSIQNPVTDANVVGSGVYTSGGYVVNLGTTSSVTESWFDATFVGPQVNLSGRVAYGIGAADANDVTFGAVSGATVEAVCLYVPGMAMIALITGKHIVTAAATAAGGATSIAVDRLIDPIPSGTVLTFSNGASATLSAAASAGARSISVNALAASVTVDSRALAPATGSGLPVTPNGGDITITWSNSPNRIFKL